MTKETGLDDRFRALVTVLLGEPGVTPPGAEPGSRGFGSDALKVDGRIFAMLSRGALVVKLPRSRVASLVAEGRGTRFDPGHGRLMQEWLAVGPAGDDEWRSLATEALAFVRGVRSRR